ncbi:MAG: hypothetical protein IKL27_06540 [Oscillospiraceae bacterium]|nr:hypothetical protein [Oscillospiraceae bacterium]
MKKKKLYPGTVEAEQQRCKGPEPGPEPDFIAGAPNYDKFHGWAPEEVLVFLNID